jgi:hypothetical protein
MGMIEGFLSLLFGGTRNVVKDTAEVFRENAEAGAARATTTQHQAMAQFGQEFLVERKGGFDRLMDGINRLPRPALALGTLGLFVAAMVERSGSPRGCRVSPSCRNRFGGCWASSCPFTSGRATR